MRGAQTNIPEGFPICYGQVLRKNYARCDLIQVNAASAEIAVNKNASVEGSGVAMGCTERVALPTAVNGRSSSSNTPLSSVNGPHKNSVGSSTLPLNSSAPQNSQ